MARLARPGGTVALQEPDSAGWVCDPPHPAFDRLRTELIAVYPRVGKDFEIGRRTAKPPARRRPARRPRDRHSARHAARRLLPHVPADTLCALLREPLLAGGTLTADRLDRDVAEVRRHLRRPDTITCQPLLWQAWATKPQTTHSDREGKHPMPRAHPIAAAAALALTAGALGGCAGHDPAPRAASGQFVAPVNGSRAFVALVSDGHRLTAYVCDGRHTGAWLTGPIRRRPRDARLPRPTRPDQRPPDRRHPGRHRHPHRPGAPVPRRHRDRRGRPVSRHRHGSRRTACDRGVDPPTRRPPTRHADRLHPRERQSGAAGPAAHAEPHGHDPGRHQQYDHARRQTRHDIQPLRGRRLLRARADANDARARRGAAGMTRPPRPSSRTQPDRRITTRCVPAP